MGGYLSIPDVTKYWYPKQSTDELPKENSNLPHNSPEGKSISRTALAYLSSMGAFVRPVLNCAIQPLQTIAERESIIGMKFVQLQEELTAIRKVLENYDFRTCIEQKEFFEYLIESVEGPELFYENYTKLPPATTHITMRKNGDLATPICHVFIDQLRFKKTFLKCREAFLHFINTEVRGLGNTDCIFNQIEAEIRQLDCEKESLFSCAIDDVRMWLKGFASSTLIDSTKEWLMLIPDMKQEWDFLINKIYNNITYPIEIFHNLDEGKSNISINEINYLFRFIAHFEYRKGKKGVLFSVRLTNANLNCTFSGHFCLRKNVAGQSIEILTVENNSSDHEGGVIIDDLIYHLIAEILLKERYPDFCVVQTDHGLKRALSDYGYEQITQEGKRDFPYDWLLDQTSAESYLKDKPRYLQRCQIGLI